MSRPSLASDGNAATDMVSGINVTPLVDITLVLLIIFMVTAKIAVSQSISMDFPKGAAPGEIERVLGVELHANGDILVDGKRVQNDESIFPIARDAYAGHKQMRAVIRADSGVQHGRVIHVLDLVKQAGITRIAFGAHPPAGGGSPSAPAEMKP
ncbi:Biopolymer transport protein ExbD/TolR [Minicystis rosea]|nr:Biopolymer transport protein ExbD/TolR [Minicystis rosea]